MGACIGEVHHETQARKRLTGAAEAGMTWLLRRCPIIDKIDFYLTCPEEEQVREREREGEREREREYIIIIIINK